MNANVSKLFRSVQVLFPSIQDYRFQAQRNLRTILNRTHEDDFEALRILPRTSNNLFLDIGANRGDAVHSILMRRPDAKVIGFEPNTILVEKVKNVYKNDLRVEVRNHGLGDKEGSFELYVPFYNNYMFDGLASFIERRAHRALINRLYGFNPEKLEVKKLVCAVKRLDSLNLQPYFIKIDVQGFEYEVLLGGEKTIRESKPILLIETPDTKELSFLTSLNFEPFVFKKGKLIPGTTGMNVFFIHRDLVGKMM
jgi:FkbM family methyltransferase